MEQADHPRGDGTTYRRHVDPDGFVVVESVARPVFEPLPLVLDRGRTTAWFDPVDGGVTRIEVLDRDASSDRTCARLLGPVKADQLLSSDDPQVVVEGVDEPDEAFREAAERLATLVRLRSGYPLDEITPVGTVMGRDRAIDMLDFWAIEAVVLLHRLGGAADPEWLDEEVERAAPALAALTDYEDDAAPLWVEAVHVAAARLRPDHPSHGWLTTAAVRFPLPEVDVKQPWAEGLQEGWAGPLAVGDLVGVSQLHPPEVPAASGDTVVLRTTVDPAGADVNVLASSEGAVSAVVDLAARRLDVRVVGRPGASWDGPLFARVVRKDAELSVLAIVPLALVVSPREPGRAWTPHYHAALEDLPAGVDPASLAVEVTSSLAAASPLLPLVRAGMAYDDADVERFVDRAVQRALAYERLGYATARPPGARARPGAIDVAAGWLARAARAWDELARAVEAVDPDDPRVARARHEAAFARGEASSPSPSSAPGAGGRRARRFPFTVEWARQPAGS